MFSCSFVPKGEFITFTKFKSLYDARALASNDFFDAEVKCLQAT